MKQFIAGLALLILLICGCGKQPNVLGFHYSVKYKFIDVKPIPDMPVFISMATSEKWRKMFANDPVRMLRYIKQRYSGSYQDYMVDRICNKRQACLLFQLHYSHSILKPTAINGFKSDFLYGVLKTYHNMHSKEIYELCKDAEYYASNPTEILLNSAKEKIVLLEIINGALGVYVRGYYRRDGTYVRPHTRRYPRR